MSVMRQSPVGTLLAEHARIARPTYKTENYDRKSTSPQDNPFAKLVKLKQVNNAAAEKTQAKQKEKVFLSRSWGFL